MYHHFRRYYSRKSQAPSRPLPAKVRVSRLATIITGHKAVELIIIRVYIVLSSPRVLFSPPLSRAADVLIGYGVEFRGEKMEL